MNKNKEVVETAKISQPTQKDKIPTGKVKTLKAAKERKEAREKQYREFRINSLKRRAKRLNLSEDTTSELVEKLIAQLDAPKEYSILVMFNKNDGKMFKEALNKANIHYKFHSNEFFAIDGDEKVLAKIREIAPIGAKIHPYAKKMESIFKDYISKNNEKSPTNNTKEIKLQAKRARKTATKNAGKKLNKFKKRVNIASLDKEKKRETMKKIKALRASFKAMKKTTKQLNKSRSQSFKKAYNTIKKAA